MHLLCFSPRCVLHAFVPADLFGREAAAGARLLSAFLARIFSPLATTLFRHPCLLPTSLLAYFSSVYSCNCVYVCVSLYLHNCLCTAVHPTSRSCFSSAPHLPQHALVYFVSLPSSHLPAAGLVDVSFLMLLLLLLLLVDVSFLMLTSSLTTHYLCGKCGCFNSQGEFSNLSFSFGQPHLISVLCNFEECAEAPGILVFFGI